MGTGGSWSSCDVSVLSSVMLVRLLCLGDEARPGCVRHLVGDLLGGPEFFFYRLRKDVAEAGVSTWAIDIVFSGSLVVVVLIWRQAFWWRW